MFFLLRARIIEQTLLLRQDIVFHLVMASWQVVYAKSGQLPAKMPSVVPSTNIHSPILSIEPMSVDRTTVWMNFYNTYSVAYHPEPRHFVGDD